MPYTLPIAFPSGLWPIGSQIRPLTHAIRCHDARRGIGNTLIRIKHVKLTLRLRRLQRLAWKHRMYLMHVARAKLDPHGAESYVLYGTQGHTNASSGVLADRRDVSPPVSDHVQLHR